MRERFLAALLTFAVFAAGFGAGLWAERHRPLPPPPGPFMGEFGGRPAHKAQTPPVNRAQLLEQISRLQPEMASFQARITEIYAEFDRDMESSLSPEQREKYDNDFKNRRNQPLPEIGSGNNRLTDEQIEFLLQRPFRTLAFFVVLPMTLDRMSSDLKLDEAERGRVRDLLRIRREKFIELCDGAPPPSLMLSRLVPVAQRICGPAKPAPAPAH